ncbi:MAG: hypothetical protein ACFFDX_13535 [Candidatus Odinarchaeota archaeon]
MNKTDYLYMILDNILVFNINLPPEFQGNGLDEHLSKFDEYGLKVIAGFNKNFLEHFLKISKGRTQNDIEDTLKKMEKISYMVGPIGNLNYLTPEQVNFILTKIKTFKLEEINEEKIGLVADDLLREQFGSPGNYSAADALENQLSSAAFYLMNMGYSDEEIQEKFNEVRQHPSKLGELFTLPQKEIYSMPNEITEQSHSVSPPSSSESEADNHQSFNDVIARHVQSIHQDITEDRAQKVDEILQEIKAHVKDNMSELQEKVFRQMHPDRLNRALKMLRTTKRKSKRMQLYLEWFSESFLLSKIELKVEHWQVSSSAGHGNAGVYTAGIDFSRYDNIIREFPDNKLTKVVNITRKILQNPSKKAIQKLGQDLIAETGFDEHLYFTD